MTKQNILYDHLVHFKTHNNCVLLQKPTYPTKYEHLFIFPKTLGDFISTGDTSHDYFPTELDGDPYVATYNNFTVNSGHTVTTTNRCKGMYLKILGDLTINGTLSMTARGAKAVGKYVGVYPSLGRVYFNSEDTFSDTLKLNYSNLLISNIGGAMTAYASNNSYLHGNIGINNACGGGGSGGRRVGSSGSGLSGRGAAGTSFSGGAGGGALNLYGYSGTNAYDGASDGGAGGNGRSRDPATTYPRSAGGGAGNPGGSGSNVASSAGKSGSTGTGGLMILIVHGNVIIGDTGSIQANGSNGGASETSSNNRWGSGGGGSGGGAIHIFHKKDISNIDKITVTGGTGGTGVTRGGNGGDGSLSLIKY